MDQENTDRPAFLITIDTEGDNLWSRPRDIETQNSQYLPRFQSLCERFGFKPTWLTNHEMVNCNVFAEFALDTIKRNTAEVGMHLHAWNSPPMVPLTTDEYHHQPFLIEYPRQVMADKIAQLTDRLRERFGCRIASHRAGRWAMNETYVELLVTQGYQVDCSVTPFVSWKGMTGAPQGSGGIDYSNFPSSPYKMAADDISRPSDKGMLQVPMTIHPIERNGLSARLTNSLTRTPIRPARRIFNYLLPQVAWLRPNGRNRSQMIQTVQRAQQRGANYVEFMLHSSELMPGGSPRFPTERTIEKLYDDLEALFEAAHPAFRGLTLAEFADYQLNHEKYSEPRLY
ncbi:hypothetical protein N9D23_13845 [Rubripirellula sp.]|nr:hypothetical protein [Rubripirellula sp.]